MAPRAILYPGSDFIVRLDQRRWRVPRENGHPHRFAEAVGSLAKTDRVDAAMLAPTGAMLELKTRPPGSDACSRSRSFTWPAKPW